MEVEQQSMAINSISSNSKHKLNIISIRRTWLIIKTLFARKSSDSIFVFILLFLLCVGQQLIVYHLGLLPSNFFKVLGDKSKAKFKPLLIKAFSFILLISLCKCAVNVSSGHLYVIWRERLTNHIQKKYFASSSILYYINVAQRDVDNVDQRIGQDVERFCSQLRDIAPKLVISPLTIIYYSIQCFEESGYVGPLVIYTYFVLGTLVNKLIMSPIVKLVFKQEKCEGDFRYWHTVIRSYAESISFLGGTNAEFKKVSQFFRNLVKVQRNIINAELFLNFSINFFDYLGSILSYIIISVSIFAGKYDNLSPVSLSALISRNAFVSMYLISCFSTLIDMSTGFTDLFAYSHRIGELIESLNYGEKNLTHTESHAQESWENLVTSEKNHLLSVHELSYSATNSTNNLVTNLSISVEENRSVLITGKAGSGKSSFFRILLGIWKPVKGKVRFNIPRHKLFFLPQKPFLTNGSLIDQVIYPLTRQSIVYYEQISSILNEVSLQTVILRAGGIDKEPSWNWCDGLSPGEIQRLSFARVLYHQPSVAILDEPTSALSIEEEAVLFNVCQQRGITYITVGHRESLKQFHKVCLNIEGNGTWTCNDLSR